MRYCSVKNCSNNSGKTNASYFSFPKDAERARLWAKACGRFDLLDDADNVIYKHFRICGHHFEKKMFLNDLKNRLHSNALPTIFPSMKSTSESFDHTYSYFGPNVVSSVNQDSSETSDVHVSSEVLQLTCVPVPPITILQNIVIKDDKKPEVIPLKDYQELCRTCLTKNGLLNLFEKKHNDLLLSNIFSSLSLLQVNISDNLPKKICETCAEILIQFYIFKERIHQSEIVLNNVFKNDSISGINKDDDDDNDENDNTNLFLEDIKSENENDNEKTKSNNKIDDITCPFCNTKFNSYSSYLIHRRKEAESRRKKKHCTICNKLISTYKLKDHINSHTKETPYECNECGEKYRFRSSLSRHKFVHQEKKPHECHICGKGFIQSPTLTDHIRTHYSEKNFICNVCGKKFKTKHTLSNHIYMHRNDDENIKNKVCNNRFQEFLCSQCGKKFSTKFHLNHHQKCHSGVKTNVCGICKKGFLQKNSLLKHNLIHRGDKPHVCIICGKRFSQKGHLTYHMRKHSGERPYSCGYCEKTFSHSGSYKVHIRIHTGERPYICDVCNKGFYDSSSMKKHRKIHEENDDNKLK